MDIFIGVVVGLLVLMVLVTAHEWGHFIAARRNGVRVLEFGIGFPPRAIAWIKDKKTGKWRRLKKAEWKKSRTSYSEAKKGYSDGEKSLAQKGMIFSFNWLPIGGFCQMDGESAADTRAGTFGKASFWAKTKILFAGVTMNWLVAFLIFTVLAWTGMPTFLDNQFTVPEDTKIESVPVQITSVAEDSPAHRAGLAADDYILAVDGNNFIYSSDISDYNSTRAGESVTYTIIRGVDEDCIKKPECGSESCTCNKDAEIFTTDVTLNPKDSEYLLGVTMASTQTLTYSTWSAPIVGAGLTLQLTGETFKGLGIMVWDLITGIGAQFSPDANVREDGQEAISSVGDSVSGPVGIIGVLFPAFTSAGPTNLAFLAALISVSLACMNVLPIPALDGGRWFLIALYKLRGKKLDQKTEEKIVARAFLVLIALIIIVTVLDIIRLAK
ncbi:site-2 protease family protein [Candidatus Saccharibacteria bacterium]|nr:site-2 protease family protein [Candidatus Saccharibacteria bacterium]